MHKYFIDKDIISNSQLSIEGDAAHHIINVLRAKKGEKVIFCDGSNTDYISELRMYDSKRKCAVFDIIDVAECTTEPNIFISLYQSIIKWDKFDFIIQKSVEVGVGEIIPVVSERSNYNIADALNKTGRFNRIAKSAAEQSKRGRVPKVLTPVKLIDVAKKNDIQLYGCLGASQRIKDVCKTVKSIGIFIGPEGGFSDCEKNHFEMINALPVKLSARVLRSETACIVAVALINDLYAGL